MGLHSDMNENVNTYLINLDRDEARANWMVAQLKSHDIRFQRVSAIDGKRLDGAQRNYHQHPRRAHLSLAEIGCLLSHIKVWDLFLKDEVEYALILEDDVHFVADFSSFLTEAIKHVKSNEIAVHRLETFNARITMERKVVGRSNSRECRRLITNHGGAAAYILNRAAARHLLGARESMQHLPDTEMFDPVRRHVKGLKVYQWLPAPCIQDMHHSSPIGLTSSLTGSRSDDLNGLTRKPSGFVGYLKKLGRPAYTFFYDLALWPKGRTRRLARFK